MADREPKPHRGVRRAGATALAVLVAAAGVVGLLILVNSRDGSNVDHGPSAAAGPGRLLPDEGDRHLPSGQRPSRPYASDPPASGPHVPAPITRDETALTNDQLLHAIELGDVVVLYGTARPPAALRTLAGKLAGPFDAALAQAGQAVVLGRRPGTRGLVAVAWRHLLPVPSATDPALERFIDYWLGRGAGG